MTHKKLFILIIILMFSLMVGIASAQPPQPTPPPPDFTPLPPTPIQPRPTATITPTIPSPTPSPTLRGLGITPTPTAPLVITPTSDDFPINNFLPLPPTSGRAYITRENILEVGMLARVVPPNHDESYGLVGVEFSPDGRYIVVSGNRGTIHFYDLIALRRGENAPLFSRIDGTDTVWDVAFHPYLDRLITCVAGDNLLILSDFEGHVLAQVDTGLSATQCNYSPDGMYIAYAGGDMVKIFTVSEDDGVQINEMERTFTQLNAHDAIFSPDGMRLFTAGGQNFTIRDWGTTFDTFSSPYDNNTWSINPLPNGNMIATGGSGFVGLYDVNGMPIATFSGHTMDVIESAYNPDATLFATGSWDNQLLLWDATGENTRPLTSLNHGEFIVDVAWSRDGALIATVGNNGYLILWGLP